MKLGWSLFCTLALVTISVQASAATELNFLLPMVLLSSAWVAFDSVAIGLRRYQTWLAWRPGPLFLAVLLLWIVGFPTYLYVRQKVLAGEVALKEAEEGDERN